MFLKERFLYRNIIMETHKCQKKPEDLESRVLYTKFSVP